MLTSLRCHIQYVYTHTVGTVITIGPVITICVSAYLWTLVCLLSIFLLVLLQYVTRCNALGILLCDFHKMV